VSDVVCEPFPKPFTQLRSAPPAFYGREPYDFVMLFLILRTGGIRADKRDIDVLADDFIVSA
jgi:hypothetical protein